MCLSSVTARPTGVAFGWPCTHSPSDSGRHLRHDAGSSRSDWTRTHTPSPARNCTPRSAPFPPSPTDHGHGRALSLTCGNEDIAEELLERGAAVHAKDRYGQTALHYACAAGSYPVVALLLARRAGVNVATQHGQTALMKAAYVTHHHAAMIADLLLSHRARPDAQTPVVAPAAAAAPATSKAGSADTNAVAAVGGASAASIAVQNDHMEILHVLAHYGANINIADGAGNTLLHLAAARAASL